MIALAATGCAKTNHIESSHDGDIITQTVGADGATLALDDGTQVFIPADALAKPQQIRLARVGSGYPPIDGATAESFIYSLEPHDLELQTEAKLTIIAAKGVLALADEESPWTPTDSERTKGVVVGTTLHGGYFAALAFDSSDDELGYGGAGGAGGADDAGGAGGAAGAATVWGAGDCIQLEAPLANAAIGETQAFYLEDATDEFGASGQVLKALSLDGTGPAVTTATMAGTATLAVVEDTVYWINLVDDYDITLHRSTATGPAELLLDSCSSIECNPPKPGVGGYSKLGGLTSAYGSVLFTNPLGQIQIYDHATSTLDETFYGKGRGTRSEEYAFTFEAGGKIGAGPLGSPAIDTGIVVQASRVVGLGAVGQVFGIVVQAEAQQNLITYDTSDAGAPHKTLASFTVRSPQATIDRGEFFTATYLDGDATSDLVKVSLVDGTQTNLATFAQTTPSRVWVNSQYAYVMQTPPEGQPFLCRWPR